MRRVKRFDQMMKGWCLKNKKSTLNSKTFFFHSFLFPPDVLPITQDRQETQILLPGDLWTFRNQRVPPKSWELPLPRGLELFLSPCNICLKDHQIIYCTEKLFLMTIPNGFNTSFIIIFLFPEA